MTPNAKKKLIGAIIAAALAVAVYYGLIGQQQADNIRTQADQTLGTGPAAQQPQQTAPQPAPAQGPATTQTQPPAASPQTTQPAH